MLADGLAAAVGRDLAIGALFGAAVMLFVFRGALVLRVRRRVEHEQHLLRSRLGELAGQTNDIVLLLEEDGTILDANDRAVEAYGYSLADLRALNVRALRSPEEREAVGGDMASATKAGRFRGETMHVRKDGSTFPVEVSARLVEDGETVVFLDVVRDITERRRVEATLRASEERLRTITTSARDAIVMIDNAGNVCYWNPAAEELFGYPAEEVRGRNLHEIIAPPKFHPAQRQAFAVWQRTGEGAAIGRTLELPARRKDGSECIVEMSLSSVYGEDGWNAVAVARNVSARKQAELELRLAKEAAEIARGELLLANARLETSTTTAQEMAEQARTANAAKSEFLARMSHEIRTPMNAVIGMTGLLLDTRLNEEQRDYAETVRVSAEALLGIINDILDHSKIEAGKLELERVEFDLRETIDDAVEMFAVAAEKKGLVLTGLIADEVPARVLGDSGRLRQVLMNLLGNALKFTEAGEVSLRVARESAHGGQVSLSFSVRDTGIGIPEGKVDDLFTSFTQVDSSITRRYGGTGLGLAIAKRLVEMMGGRIAVQSREGQGTTIRFTVVLTEADHGTEPPAVPEEMSRQRVLIVDDNATNRFVLSEQLRPLGCRHEAASDALAALAKLRAAATMGDPFSIAIIDSAMPDVDGEELVRRIGAEPLLAGTRLVLCSSWTARTEADRLRAAGVSAVLTKPLRRADLHRALVALVRPVPARRDGLDAPRDAAVRAVQPRLVRALVADDNAVNQKLAVRLLDKIGVRADAVANGREAIEALAACRYDVVFMDVQMPEMDGLDATRAIRSREAGTGCHLPVIAMTAHAMKGDRQRCLDAGMDDYVSKPVDRHSLEAAVNRVLVEHTAPVPAEDLPSGLPVFDQGQLLARVGYDGALMREMIEAFLADTPGRLRQLVDAAHGGDLAEVQVLAHTLKGAGRTMGAGVFGETAGRIEAACRDGEGAAAFDLVPALRGDFDALEPVLAGLCPAGTRG